MIGQPSSALDTPALLVDLDILEANIARIAETCASHGVAWRPHVKGHKTAEIARLQVAAGAAGITCAKLGEAEVMADAGFRDILIANQIVGPLKVARLMKLLDRAAPIVAVDSLANVAELGRAAAGRDRRLAVVIEVNLGMNRAGVDPGAPVLALAAAIARHDGLRFVGLMGWESHAVAIADPAEKAQTVASALGLLTASAEACRRAGHDVAIVSCGGTGTFPYCAQQPGVTEVEVGGAIFSDMHYRTHYHVDFPYCAQQPGVTEVEVGGAIFSDVHYRTHYHVDFPCALTVLATVTSRPTATRIILDAGKKTLSSDAAVPQPLGLGEFRSVRLSAEHATIELAEPADVPRVGDRIAMIVGYSDTTVHLHETMVGMRGGRIEQLWPIIGRGRIK